MHSHLVSVEVGVERCTDKRVELYSIALYEYWLESLYTEPVESRSTVEEYVLASYNFLENGPH
ncbi:MAG: hypothetical protein WDZ61_00230, partial [Parcubacteria group bacterium]